jgi:xylan 1,4-beta-xylosidase
MRKRLFAFAVSLGILLAQDATIPVKLDLRDRLGPMGIDRFGVGQGGFSPEPMWSERLSEVRNLKPRVIRLFMQEYFNLLPERGRYQFETLDRSVDLIVKTGAKPLLCIAFKPKVLFPAIDQNNVVPSSWEDWDALIYNLVKHYKDRGGKGWYWEVSNEPNLQSGGGTPYHFTPDNYTGFYQRTVAAILRADPEAHVGGPALAGWESPILPALLSFCESARVPLHFVSWHGYSNDPTWFRNSIEGVKRLLAKHPGLHPETVIDEWNMALGVSVVDPRFQPCFIAETSYQMLQAGLDLSAYYHIRDYPLAVDEFLRFFPKEYTIREMLFWDRRPIYLGLFDLQNRVRPAYFLMKAMSRLTGTRLRVESPSPAIHGLAATDEELRTTSVLLWNFSKFPAKVSLEIGNAPAELLARTFVLDATGPSDDDTARLRPVQPVPLKGGNGRLPLELEPYGVTLLSLEEGH